MKFIYLVDHFVPFPSSEYGGLWVVIADNNEECFDLIIQEDNDLNTKHYSQLKENIVKSQKFVLKDDYESGVIEAFLT